MSFLYPAFLLGGLAIAVPIVLHLLRRDVAPEVPFTAVRLLHKSPVERAHRRRLRELILLAARIAALLLLATAFARPFVAGATPPPVLVVAVDRSYSMGGSGTFERARDLARQAIETARGGERIAVIAFDDRAEVVAPLGSAADARASVDRLQPGYGATRYPAVFQQAVDLAAGAEGRLVLVTDLQRAGWDGDAAVPSNWTLEIRDVREGGRGMQNLAVTSATVDGDQVLASIENDGSSPQRGRVRALVNGKESGAAEYTVAAGSTSEVAIPVRPPGSGTLSVVVDDPEGLPADNARFVALGSAGAGSVLIVTTSDGSVSGGAKPAAFYVSRAAGTVSASGVTVVPASSLTSMSPQDLGSFRAVALLSTRGLERTAREQLMAFVKSGGGLLMTASPDLELPVIAEMTGWQPPLVAKQQAGPLTLAATDLRHPVFQPFGALSVNLGQARFERAWRVAEEGWSVLARFSNGTPALLERTVERGRVVLFASDVDRRWNDFPVHPAFVPFVLETLRYVGGNRSVHDYVVAQAPAEARRTPGVYQDADGRAYAVNVDIRESGLATMDPADFDRQVQRSGLAQSAAHQAVQTEAHQSYWQYGLVLMIATLIAESAAGRA
jgi:hypothetical protein